MFDSSVKYRFLSKCLVNHIGASAPRIERSSVFLLLTSEWK